MNEYPDWVDFVSLLGLDPITVWIEYRVYLFLLLALLALLIVFALYSFFIRFRGLIAHYQHSFADRLAFYRSLEEVDPKYHEGLKKALAGEKLTYLVPAIAAENVPGFRRSIGHVMLTPTRLIFAAGGASINYPLDSFPDANVHDGLKHMELKLIFPERKPLFHLLGITRDHAQEIFMKMHAYRLALKEAATTDAPAEPAP